MKSINTRAAYGRPPFIEVEENVRLHITDLGEGDPVVLIHGWPLSNAMYEYQYQYLIKEGCRVIGISLRGFGLSDKPYGKYNYDVFADDIKIVLETLEIEDAVLGGFSMGAAVAIRYAAMYNAAHISKLALFATAAPIWTERKDFAFGIAREIVNGLIRLNNTDRPGLLEVFAGIFTGEQSLSPSMAAWLSNINWQASSYAMEQCLILLRDADLRSDLKSINIPAVIFHGRKDKICPFNLSEQLHNGIHRSYLVPFENSGHALFIEESEKFNSMLLKFIRAGIPDIRPNFQPPVLLSSSLS